MAFSQIERLAYLRGRLMVAEFGLENAPLGVHLRGMMYPSTTIKFQPLPLNVGMEWHVVVT